ncbi:chorismate synthase [Macrococcus armenti]|uniref:chorismate synthase n=1 Tax=Macrococcus armenti TaxID=2875764 RepID=UPI001CD00859|nr:chorismate synthase [Macrococcus armenti]UBH07622.1 chorismate synthase [Macrococcus armenti]UBH14397.1 chorismate synthase [Macrococcus armenti]UBH16757.1 chorismate synthase [Macrococcus armenti]UBH19020.1 chorismate synthase [Macrococcus armenti]
MRFLTAGESHGPKLTVIIEGIPSNMALTSDMINKEMFKRQGGYGRGRRMQIEKDTVVITSGVRHGVTLGSPITIEINNDDHKHWLKIMGVEVTEDMTPDRRKITKPRPGHADLVGGMKYRHRDLRNVLERSSARETAARVAVGAVCKVLLNALGIEIYSRVIEIGGARDTGNYNLSEIKSKNDQNDVRCIDVKVAQKMRDKIDEAKSNGDSIGGEVQVIAEGVPAGLGSYVHYDRKLDGKIAQSVISINAFKAVSFGAGNDMKHIPGSKVQDPIGYDSAIGFNRMSNNLGGFEGGMTNGMPIIVNAVMKPIPTLYKPLQSVDIDTKEVYQASIERSDSCAVPAASVVCEHAVAFELAKEILNEFQSNDLNQLKENIACHNQFILEY